MVGVPRRGLRRIFVGNSARLPWVRRIVEGHQGSSGRRRIGTSWRSVPSVGRVRRLVLVIIRRRRWAVRSVAIVRRRIVVLEIGKGSVPKDERFC